MHETSNYMKYNFKKKTREIHKNDLFFIPQVKVAHSLPAVLTKVPLFAEGMRKNCIRDSGVNKECLKQQVYHPRLRLGR